MLVSDVERCSTRLKHFNAMKKRENGNDAYNENVKVNLDVRT